MTPHGEIAFPMLQSYEGRGGVVKFGAGTEQASSAIAGPRSERLHKRFMQGNFAKFAIELTRTESTVMAAAVRIAPSAALPAAPLTAHGVLP